MAAGVNASIRLTIDGYLQGSNDLGSPKMTLSGIDELLELTPGTGSTLQADLMFSDTRTLAASANEDIDLVGSLTTAFGATISAAELVLILVKAAPGNTNNVRVTRPASNGVPIFLAASDGRDVEPGEFFLFISRRGVGLTAGTVDLINIANSAGTTSVAYDILVFARSVAA